MNPVSMPPAELENRRASSSVSANPEDASEVRSLRVVAIGGGTGLSTLLRGLRRHVSVPGQPVSSSPQISDLAAVVTVTDDGGSSGRLRKDFNMLPPGDLRNCMVALSEEEDVLSKLFAHRFRSGDALEGHNFGTSGVTIQADTGRVLAIVQNTKFNESSNADITKGETGLVYAADEPGPGSPLDPPSPRSVDVLLHAIRHLRFLLDTDDAVRPVLAGDWRRHLAHLQPAPAGRYLRRPEAG